MAKAKGTTESGTSGIDSLNPSGLRNSCTIMWLQSKLRGSQIESSVRCWPSAQDLQRGQRTLTATRLPGQANTAQDVINQEH
jgi:hypothetical protein